MTTEVLRQRSTLSQNDTQILYDCHDNSPKCNMNSPDRTDRRFFAVASLEEGRWYWVVWPSLAELQAADEPLFIIADGFGETQEKAVERALNMGGRHARRVAAKFARDHYDRHVRAQEIGGMTGGRHSAGAPAPQEFLYREVYDPAREAWVSMPHRVARTTPKYVFVERQPYNLDVRTGAWLDRERPTYRLDRKALERDGFAYIPASAVISDDEEPLFFSQPGSILPVFACLKTLELSWPCTQEDVKAAYRRLVKTAHPDGGGDHARFLALQEAYDAALRLVSASAGPRR